MSFLARYWYVGALMC